MKNIILLFFSILTVSLSAQSTKVPLNQIVDLSGLSVLGRASNSSGVMAAITGTDGQVLRVNSTTLGFGTIVSAGITDGTIVNDDLSSGTGGFYKGNGTISGSVVSTLADNAAFSLEYFTSTNSALFVDEATNSTTVSSGDATQYLYVDDVNVTIGSGTSKMEYIDGVLRVYDSDASNYISVQTPATGSLTANYALTLPVNDGDANQVLGTNGSGSLSWITSNGIYGGSGTVPTNVTATLTDNLTFATGASGLVTIGAPGGGIYGGRAEIADSYFYAGTDNIYLLVNPEDQYILLRSSATNRIEVNATTGTFLNGTVLLANGTISSGHIRFVEDDDNGANYVQIQSPSSLASDYTLTLPTDDGDANEVLTSNGSGVLSWEPPGSGSGDIINGGNTTGATVVIGTNDANILNLETNNVVRMSITGEASTGGAFTLTNVTANTNAVQDVITVISNSTGTATTSFGPGILLQGESSTTDSRDMARIAAMWTTATDASRESKISIQLGNNGGALAEIANFNVSGNNSGQLSIGSSTAVTIQNSGITTATTFVIGNSSSQINITSGASSSGGILIYNTGTNSGSYINLGGDAYWNQSSGTRYTTKFTTQTSASSGTGAIVLAGFNNIINQTGTASGSQTAIEINPTLTALLGNYRAIDIQVNHSLAKGIYQSGSSTTNNFVGNTTFGSTNAPNASAIIDIVSTTKGLGFPSQTVSQRDAISSPREGLFVYNSDTKGLDFYNGTRWQRISQTAGTPTVVVESGAGTGPSASISGNDMSGKVTITMGTTIPGGKMATISFDKDYVSSAVIDVVISNADTDSGTGPYFYVSNEANTGFEIWNDNGFLLNESTPYIITYKVTQRN